MACDMTRFGRRAQESPAFLGYTLAQYRDGHGLTDELLAAELGVPIGDYWNLCTCGSVRVEHRAADLHEIATTFGADPDALARVV